MFSQFLKQVLGAAQTADNVLPSGWAGLKDANQCKVALYNDTTTPNKDGDATTAAFNGTGGPWVTANQVTDATNWPSGGIVLTGGAITAPGSGVVMFDAADTTHASTVTITNAYGCLVYLDEVTAGTGGTADLGVTYHSFGGAQSVTAGTFTVTWNALGLFRITV